VRFFIDENSHRNIGPLLQQIYPAHEYANVADECLGGYEDLALFPELARRGFDAIITNDRQQLRNSAERDALITSRLHWIGHTRVNVAGPAGVALTVSGVIAGFPFVLAQLSACPAQLTAFDIKAVPISPGQRVKISLL